MILPHGGKTPAIDPSAWIAPTATVAGDVVVGPGCRVGFGASVVSEGAPLVLGTNVIVMENAVVRATATHPTTIGSHCVIGPLAPELPVRDAPELVVHDRKQSIEGGLISAPPGDKKRRDVVAMSGFHEHLRAQEWGWATLASAVDARQWAGPVVPTT